MFGSTQECTAPSHKKQALKQAHFLWYSSAQLASSWRTTISDRLHSMPARSLSNG